MDAENAIIGAENAFPLIDAAINGRVDFLGIGDSNEIHAGGGHSWGMGRALDGIFGTYATGNLPLLALGGYANSYPVVAAGPNGGSAWNTSAPPAQLLAYALSATHADGWPERSFVYLDDAQSVGAELTVQNLGGMYAGGHPWRITDEFRHHLRYGTFTAGAGSFKFEARQGGTIFATSPLINPVTGAYGLQDATLLIPASATRTGLDVSLGELFGSGGTVTTQGPFFGLYQRWESTRRSRGVSYGTLLYQGGQSTRNAATSLKAATQAAVTAYLDNATRLQGAAAIGDRRLCVHVSHLGNDQGDGAASWNPATENFDGPASNTATGAYNNTRGVITYLSRLWTGAGGVRGNLYIWLGPYHMTPTSTAALEALEAALVPLVAEQQNVTLIRGTRLTTHAEMTARHWYYNPPGDVAHMSFAGSEGINRYALEALLYHYAARPKVTTLLPLIQDAANNADNAATTAVEVRNAHTTTQGIATEAKEAAEATLAYVTARPPVRINARAS